MGPEEGGIARKLSDSHLSLTARLPPVRVLWIGLLVLAADAGYRLGATTAALGLLAFPLTAVVVDLLLQGVRFPEPRFPDAAIVTGLFLAVILPPSVPLVAGIAVTFAAVGLRHALRTQGRPWFNPAALGVLFAAALFYQPPAWWGSLSLPLTVAVGAAVLAFNRRSWRLPIAFLASYAGIVGLLHALMATGSGTGNTLSVVLLSVTDPTTLFFGLLMVPEPRSAPKDVRIAQPVYGLGIAAGTALGPFVFPTIAPIISLLLANLGVALYRVVKVAVPATSGASKPRPTPSRAARRWSVPVRGTVAFLIVVLLGFAIPFGIPAGTPSVALVSSGPPVPPSIPAGTGTSHCLQDNPTIPPSTLKSLHNVLGPSVILSDDTSNGVVVFYDPVHHVTVSETDLYEDFGSAEFNGDDYTTSGCAAG